MRDDTGIDRLQMCCYIVFRTTNHQHPPLFAASVGDITEASFLATSSFWNTLLLSAALLGGWLSAPSLGLCDVASMVGVAVAPLSCLP